MDSSTFLLKALAIRPQLTPSSGVVRDDNTKNEYLEFQLIQGVIIDGEPTPLPANHVDRWQDHPYAVVSGDLDSGDLQDESFADTTVCLFGSTKEGNSVFCKLEGYKPYVRVELQSSSSPALQAEAIRAKLMKCSRIKNNSTIELEIQHLKRFYGWIEDPHEANQTKKFACAIFKFNNLKSAQLASTILQREGYNVTDKGVKPLARFLNDFNITPSSWIKLTVFEKLDTKFQRISNCQAEFSSSVNSLVCDNVNDSIAPIVIASFDGEMFSHDGTFPSVLKGDETIYVGVSFWTYGTSIIQRFVLCLGDIEESDEKIGNTSEGGNNITIAKFSNKKKLFEAFRDLIVAADPDFVTGWNIYGFDFSFFHADYEQLFLEPWERGSEELQVRAMQIAKEVISDGESGKLSEFNTAAKLLYNFKSKGGSAGLKDWIEKSEIKFGLKDTKAILKQLKKIELYGEVGGGLNVLENCGFSGNVAENEEDDDKEEKDVYYNSDDENSLMDDSSSFNCKIKNSDYVSAKSAADMRKDLRAKLGYSEAPQIGGFYKLIKSFSSEQIERFWDKIKQNLGAHYANLLKLPKECDSNKRGLFLSRFAAEKSKLVEKRMFSAAKGDNTYNFWSMGGRVTIDLMQIIKDDKKPDENSLKYAAIHWLGNENSDNLKMDLSAEEMFEIYRSGDAKKRFKIAEYCSRDCEIPLLLIKKLSYVPIWVEMSRVCFTWIHDVINSGQQVKVFNLISRYVHGEYALNEADSGWPKNSEKESIDKNSFMKKRKPDYQGATVIEPISGFYEDCISTLDFESLYPSIIRYFNLCPSSLVLNGQKEGVEHHSIQHNILLPSGEYKSETRQYGFATKVQGVLPRLLKRLLDARKAVKSLMKSVSDPHQWAILNGRQNGIKVACNSVYGFCGVSEDRGLLPCKPVAAVTTLKGRAFIDAAKMFVENNYKGSQVIYGDTDSIMIFWGKGVQVSEAAKLGEEAAQKITALLRSGSISSIGGAGAAFAAQEAKNLDSSTQFKNKELAEACSAVTLAYEKTYCPYLLLKKKNYAGLKYTLSGNGEFKTEIDMKGIDAVRRDRPKLLRETSNAILDALLHERSVSKAVLTLKSSLSLTASKNSPLADFVLSKSLKSSYAGLGNLPHVTAWKRMIERGDDNIPVVGTRMPYVITLDKNGGGGKHSKSKLYERSEHPNFVQDGNLSIDRQYYIENLKIPLTKLLKFVISEDTIKDIFQEALEQAFVTCSNTGNLKNLLFMEEEKEENSTSNYRRSFLSSKGSGSRKNAANNKKQKIEHNTEFKVNSNLKKWITKK